MFPRFARLVLLLTLGLVASVHAAETREPKNIFLLKQELSAYIDSGRYLEDIAAVAAEANRWIEHRVGAKKPGERLALVLDIDETLLSNLPEIRGNDFGYRPVSWVPWVRSGQAPAIAPALGIYRTARQLGIAVIILTGRTEGDRPGTEANLRAVGVEEWVALQFEAEGATSNTGLFKAAWRERLTAEGWTIIANIGDQESDLAGGFAERNFKLPNPLYLTK